MQGLYSANKWGIGMIEHKGNSEVFFSTDESIALGRAHIEKLKEQALKNERRRCRLCIHHSEQDQIHEMVIVHMRDTYVRPHRHLTRSESFYMLEGRCSLVFFDIKSGGVDRIVHLEPPGSEHPFYFKTLDRSFHTTLIHTDIAVFQEITEGPFLREDTVFPPWAPDGTDEFEVSKYLAGLHGIVQEISPYSGS